jgi:hypothetical protein
MSKGTTGTVRQNSTVSSNLYRREREPRLRRVVPEWPSAHGASLPPSRHSPPLPPGGRTPSGHAAGDVLVHADSRDPCRGAHGSCGCIQGTQALEFFEELGEVRVSGRAPKCMKPRSAGFFAWDSYVDHFGGGKLVAEGFSDLGDGFRFGRCHHRLHALVRHSLGQKREFASDSRFFGRATRLRLLVPKGCDRSCEPGRWVSQCAAAQPRLHRYWGCTTANGHVLRA